MTNDEDEAPKESAEFSVSGILSAIRERVTAETGARYARDTALVRREMLVLQPESRVDHAIKDAVDAADDASAARGAPSTLRKKQRADSVLEAQVLDILAKALRTPGSPLRQALRDALNDELGGG